MLFEHFAVREDRNKFVGFADLHLHGSPQLSAFDDRRSSRRINNLGIRDINGDHAERAVCRILDFGRLNKCDKFGMIRMVESIFEHGDLSNIR